MRVNSVAKLFIFSESFFWSAWSILLPLISVFALKEISKATIQTVSFAFSIYLCFRVIGSVLSGFVFNKYAIKKKIKLIILGIFCINIGYSGFIFITSVSGMYALYGLIGLCTGFITPLRTSIFSTHMDKRKETTEWGLLDAVVLTTMAIAATGSGYLVTNYGYKSIFIFSTVLNCLSLLPYVILLKKRLK